MKINLYEKLSNPIVLDIIEVEQWFNLICHSDYATKIITARTNPSALEELKKELPCVTYNFFYNGYKRDANRLGSTGIIFIDIDNTEIDLSKLNKTCVLGYYRSLSGNGYHILVRVDGVTPDNFKTSYEYVCKELGISNLKDDRAIKHSQFSVLSHDTEAYYNKNAQAYTAVSPSLVILTDISCIPIVSNNGRKTYTPDGDTSVRYNSLNEIDIPLGEKYITDWNGFEFFKCWIPIHKLKDGRKRCLLSYATNFVYLNPNLDFEQYLGFLNKVNEVAFEIPLPQDRIKSTLKTVIKQIREGKLKPIKFWSKRKIVFNPNMKFERGEKLSIVIQELAIHKTNQSIERIKYIIENWDTTLGKITARSIFKASQSNKVKYRLSYKTICKYYKHFKNEIAEKNKEISDSQYGTLASSTPFEYVLGGLYKFGVNVEGFKSWYPQVKFHLDFNSFTDVFIGHLKEKVLTIDFNEAEGRKELYNSVQEICKLDSGIDFDALYLDIIKLYNSRKISA